MLRRSVYLESLSYNALFMLLVSNFVSDIPHWPIGLRSKGTNAGWSPFKDVLYR